MGRLGPLNSLAFGRSPFESPELDDNGEFILGPHAHDAENKDFGVQQFDGRGHPQNDASKATIRAMQHAQNAVLETVGVVVRREAASKSAWQRQSKKRKVEDIVNENNYGKVLRDLGPFLMQSSMWWAISLRRRMQTFRSYLGPSMVHILRSEGRSMGFLSMLTDGLLPAITSSVLKNSLVGMQTRKLEITLGTTTRGTPYSWTPFTSFTAGLIIPLFVFPVKAFAVLQSLHLIPPKFRLSPWSFVPFTSASPIQFPQLPDTLSVGTGLVFATSICCNAFIVSTIRDMTNSYIHDAIYRIILLTLAPRPDHPDNLTTTAAIQDLKDGGTLLISGMGPENNAERLSRARSSDFWTELNREMMLILNRIKSLRNVVTWLHPRGRESKPTTQERRLIPQDGRQIWDRSAALQRQMVRENLDRLRENEAERIAVQTQAHVRVLAEFGLSSAIGPDDASFLLEAYQIFDSDSTATPEPVDLTEDPATVTEGLDGPPLLFDRLTSDSIHDGEEREGEGRILASLGFNDANDATSAENASQPTVYMAPSLSQGQSEIASDTTYGTRALEAALTITHEQLRVNPTLGILSPTRTHEHSPSTNIIIPDQSPTPPPQAPDSPLDRNATPPAISRNRTHSLYDSRSRSAARSRSPSSPPDGFLNPIIALSSRSSSSILHPATSRRFRRLTDTVPAFMQTRLRLGEASRNYSPLSSDDGAAHITQPVARHRVTMLSVFPAEMFAECAASLVTNIVTLPLDTLYVRALVRGFLDRPNTTRAGASFAALGLRGNVYEMGEWFGGRNMAWGGRLRYVGLMAMMLGVQGCMSSLFWTLLTKSAIAFGRQSGWGQL